MWFNMRIHFLILLGTGALSAGCGEAPNEADMSTEMPRLSSMAGPSRVTGTNGLSTLSWSLYKDTLFKATQSPLASSSPGLEHVLAPTNANNTLLSSAAGREVLGYAARCALGEGDWVSGGSPSQTFQGSGLLTTTSAWKTSGLSRAQQEDLFTCLLAHLNFYDVEVPIVLSGPSITDRPGEDSSLFTSSEAVWTTKITTNILTGAPMLQYNVWPRLGLNDLCGTLVAATLGARVCGLGLLCGLTIRTDFASACTSTERGYSCDGRPAIETILTEQGLGILHPLCGN